MALVLADRVKETTTTAGTGTLSLGGAAAGFQAFSVIGDGNSTYYTIVDSTANTWEVGIGTYTSSGSTLSRDSVFASSNSGNLVDFAANTKDVFITYPASRSYGGVSSQGVSTNNREITGVGEFPSTYSGISVGPVTIRSGAYVTVPSGQKWILIE